MDWKPGLAGAGRLVNQNQAPQRSVGHGGRRRRGRPIETDHELNIDAQDAQDNRDGTLPHGKLTSAMTRFGLADAQDCKPAFS